MSKQGKPIRRSVSWAARQMNPMPVIRQNALLLSVPGILFRAASRFFREEIVAKVRPEDFAFLKKWAFWRKQGDDIGR